MTLSLRCRLAMLACFALLLLVFAPSNAMATTITFSESHFTTASGFNGQSNETLLSSDGQYRVESFWLGFIGHFHYQSGSGFDCPVLNPCEQNHNQSGALNNLAELQGMRISRVDGQSFNLVSMDILLGAASVGQLTNFSTGAGTWNLYTTGAINFGSTFTNVNQIFLADPFAAGSRSFQNQWDNITLSSSVPEPSSLLLIGTGCIGLLLAKIRRKA
jgi:hypothetical protein